MKQDQKPIVMFTTMHTANDHRIYYKEACSLNKKYPVIVVAPLRNNGRVTDMPHKRISYIPNRLLRFVTNIRHIPAVWKMKPRVVHIHDPELLPVALLIKLLTRAKIIYDAHENQHLDLLQKNWLPYCLRGIALNIFKRIESIVLRKADGIILAEDSYWDNYKEYDSVVLVRNYPKIECQKENFRVKSITGDPIHIGYVGSVQRIRGILEMLEITAKIKHTFGRNIIFDIVGAFENARLELESKNLAQKLNIIDDVNIYGMLSHDKALELLQRIDIGLLLYHPLPTHERILPVKLYEYMLMKKPVIATDIELWHSVLTKHKCGVFVNPFDVEHTAHCIVSLYDDPKTLEEMGDNGYNAVVNEYNWSTQENNLFRLYQKIVT